MPPSLSAKGAESLQKIGVTVLTGRTVVGIEGASVTIGDGSGATEDIRSHTIVWAAGVTASSLGTRLAELTGAERDAAGRVAVEPDLTLPGHPEVFALRDMVRVRSADGPRGAPPGVAAADIPQ